MRVWTDWVPRSLSKRVWARAGAEGAAGEGEAIEARAFCEDEAASQNQAGLWGFPPSAQLPFTSPPHIPGCRGSTPVTSDTEIMERVGSGGDRELHGVACRLRARETTPRASNGDGNTAHARAHAGVCWQTGATHNANPPLPQKDGGSFFTSTEYNSLGRRSHSPEWRAEAVVVACTGAKIIVYIIIRAQSSTTRRTAR